MNPFTVLGVPFNATKDEITAAYRQLAKKSHPDLNPNDPDSARRFNELSEAYKQLIADLDAATKPRTRPIQRVAPLQSSRCGGTFS